MMFVNLMECIMYFILIGESSVLLENTFSLVLEENIDVTLQRLLAFHDTSYKKLSKLYRVLLLGEH